MRIAGSAPQDIVSFHLNRRGAGGAAEDELGQAEIFCPGCAVLANVLISAPDAGCAELQVSRKLTTPRFPADPEGN